MRSIRLSSLALLLAVALPLAAKGPGQPTEKAASSKGFNLGAMDRSVKPGDDFYDFANGGWMKRTEIPADRGSYGMFHLMAERTDQRIGELIEGLGKGAPAPGSEAAKVRDFHASFMDEATLEAQGLKPLQPTLDRVAALADRKALATFLGDSLRADVDVLNATNLTTRNLLGLWVAQDLNDPTRYAPFLLQGGLSLPDRDFYLSPAPPMEAIRKAYQAHIATVLKLAGIAEPDAKAARIFQFERRLAEAHATREETGEVSKGNNPWTREDFDTKAPGMDWEAFFAASGLQGQRNFIVWQPRAVTGLSALVASEPLETWKEYLAFQALDQAAGLLPKAFGEASFAFYGQALRGVPQQRTRAKRAINLTSDTLGEMVGKLYVQKHFSAEDKARVQTMVANILKAFERRIDNLAWMKPETKAKAKAKLTVMKVGVGYPDAWTDFSKLTIDPKDLLGNLDRIGRFGLAHHLAKLGQPVNRSEWVMTPQMVNAVNLPVMNAMNYPAAILQPPFFDRTQSDALNYGAIGAVIGHEISHSFDDQGAQFDSTGRMQNWWTDEDMAHFRASATKLVAQYDAYRPFPDVAVNGKLTLGENIADVAGLAVAFDAYQLSLQGRPSPKVAGFTGEQLFYLSFAQAWCSKDREQVLRQQLVTDGHTPARYRAYTVRNQDGWYEAFGVKPGAKLFLTPKDRVRIW